MGGRGRRLKEVSIRSVVGECGRLTKEAEVEDPVRDVLSAVDLEGQVGVGALWGVAGSGDRGGGEASSAGA